MKHHKLVILALVARIILCSIDDDGKAKAALLDGCCLLEADVPRALMETATVDTRHRDL